MFRQTLLYMLIQRAGTGTLPPPGFTIPPWTVLAAQWDTIPAPTTPTATLGPCTVTLGHHDSEPEDVLPPFEGDVAEHKFGWDNESPQRGIQVGKFRAEWRPISNKEFFAFWRESDGHVPLPPSWVEDDGEFKVCHISQPRWGTELTPV